MAIIGAVWAANSGVVPKVLAAVGGVPQEALEHAKIEMLEGDERGEGERNDVHGKSIPLGEVSFAA